MKTRFCLLLGILLAASATSVRANWTQTTGVGPYIYTDPANWAGGIIDNVITNPAPQSGITLTFTNDFTFTNGVLINFSGNSNVIFQSDSAVARTLKLSLGHFLRTNQNGGTVTVGTASSPLILDLNNSTRTIGGGTAGSTSSGNIATMNIFAQITDVAGGTNGVVCGGGNILAFLMNTNNTFKGPVSFPALRGGGFVNIKPINGGPSSLGAPLDITNAAITVADGNSSGSIKYLGAGDTSDRPFVFNVGSYHTNVSWTGDFQFLNSGSGLLKLSGQWNFPTNRTLNSEFIINAFSAPIQLDGYIAGAGNANGTFTYLLFAGGPSSVATNRITLTCPTNDFRDFVVSNVVLTYNNIAPAGTPSALGAGTNLILGGGTVGGASWLGGNGQGCSLQYVGPNAAFTRNITLNGGTSSYAWALDNAGTNTFLLWSNNIAWNFPAAVIGFNPRYLFINSSINSTSAVASQIPDANIVVSGTPIGTIVASANPVGQVIQNGGYLQLLNPANTFAGGCQAAYARTIQAMTLADIGQPSSIGTGLNPYLVGTPSIQLTGIILGSTDSQRGGILAYIGTNNASSNQKITILGSSGSVNSGTIRNDSPNASAVHLTDTGAWNLYSTMPYCLAVLGGSAHVTNTLDSFMTDVAGGTPGIGSLAVNGSAWRLTANQTYSGTTYVANATLVLDSSIASGQGLTVGSGGVLCGTGVVNEAVNVLTNGAVTAGDGAIGVLTINGNLTNSGTLFLKLNKQAGTNDVLDLGANTLVYGGVLSVTNLAGSLAAGNSFKLFNAANYQGAFASVSPATPGSGLAWDSSSLAVNGTLKIVAGAAGQPRITTTQLTGSGLVMSGTGGVATTSFYVTATTNLLAPLPWPRVSTNAFDSNGNFNVTNTVNHGIPAGFFMIQLP